MKRSLVYAFVAALVLLLGAGLAWSEDDPFADLGGGDDASAIAAPDGSSSIRAKRKVSKETWEGVVIGITRGKSEFPMIESVKVKITKAPSSKGELHRSIKKDGVYDFAIKYVMKDGAFDMKDSDNQTNVGAAFLQKGDKVQGEALEKGDKAILLKYIERK